MTGPKWNPTQGDLPRQNTITEAMEHSQKGIYHACPLKDPNKQLKKIRCRYLHPTNGQKLLTSFVELWKAERS